MANIDRWCIGAVVCNWIKVYRKRGNTVVSIIVIKLTSPVMMVCCRTTPPLCKSIQVYGRHGYTVVSMTVLKLPRPWYVAGPHLQWRDVVIVCSYLDGILENIPDMVSSLQQCGVPVQAIDRYQPERDLEDLALGITNRVYVTDYSTLSGLERRVVVGMWGAGSNRLYGMSRCTSVLAWIDPPL